jgi:hypothetical protein
VSVKGERILGMLLFLAGFVGIFATCLMREAWYVLIPAAWMAGGIILIRRGDKEDAFEREARRQGYPQQPPASPALRRAFPVVTGGAGRYHVCGVDRATGMDTEWHVHAASEENARVKADLEGITVTSVRFEGI